MPKEGFLMRSKKSVSLSIDRDIDEFLESFKTKVVKINDREVRMSKTKNELYVEALRFAIENADKWLLTTREERDETN